MECTPKRRKKMGGLNPSAPNLFPLFKHKPKKRNKHFDFPHKETRKQYLLHPSNLSKTQHSLLSLSLLLQTRNPHFFLYSPDPNCFLSSFEETAEFSSKTYSFFLLLLFPILP